MDHPHVNRLIAARALRAFGDGFVSLLLPLYLIDLGYDTVTVGLIASATLLGSGAMTLAVGLTAHRYHYRTLLLAAAAAMAATGLGFAAFTDLWPLLVIAVVGHAQSVERRRQRVPADGACGPRARRRRSKSHRRVRALRARGHARRRHRLAGRGCTVGHRRLDRMAAAHLPAGDVRRLRVARRGHRARLLRAPAQLHVDRQACRAARPIAPRGIHARGAVQPRQLSAAASSCNRWWRCGCTSATTFRSRSPARSSSRPAC